MYITIYKYDINKPVICGAIRDAAKMHQLVQYLFNSERQKFKVLYRLDQGYLIIQSDIKPICDGVFDRILQCDISEKISLWEDGKQIKFRIRTVPRVSEHGKKHYISTSDARIRWLKDQFEKRGINILSVREKGSENIKISSKINRLTGGYVKISVWEYEGMMSITDKNAFIKGYEQGIGSQKAYGCGMICLCG